MQPIAKNEKTERLHFNDHFKENERLFFSPDLKCHPDYRIIKSGIEQLSLNNNKKCMLLGCGVGSESWYLSTLCSKVFAVDIAEKPLKIVHKHAALYGFSDKVTFTANSAYSLCFPDNSFDAIFGHAILHHLDLEKAGKEIFRVLKPGALAVFTEPLDQNLILRLIRKHVPYPGKHRLPDEKALRYADVETIGSFFNSFKIQEIELTAMLGRLVSHSKISKHAKLTNAIIDLLYQFDTAILRFAPPLRPLSRAAICCFYKA